MDFNHHKFLQDVADEDVRFVKEKDRSYNASWKQSGGRSAWFMIRRKMDRMINLLGQTTPPDDFDAGRLAEARPEAYDGMVSLSPTHLDYLLRSLASEDVFAAIEARPGGEDGSVLAEVRDLRRYLLLVEAEMIARGVVVCPMVPVEAGQRNKTLFDLGRAVRDDDPGGDWAGALREVNRNVMKPPLPDHEVDQVIRQLDRKIVVDPPFSRRPVDPTQYEYDSYRTITIPSGSQRGRAWSTLYQAPGRDGRPVRMHEEFQEEYGQ